MSGGVRVGRSLVIPLDELEWRFGASGGPGGQHANTANTRVELRFDIAGSPSLGPRQRARLLARLGPSLRVVASRHRSQLRNREDALARLAITVADALRTQPRRRPTAPPRAAIERRLEEKRKRSEAKERRRAPTTTE